MRIEQLTCAIGAELLDVNLADAVRDDGLFDEIYAALLQHRVLFIRDQTLDKLSRHDHMSFAQRLGQLEDHPVAPSHPDAPGLVQIYKNPDSPIDRYENAWHCDGTFRATPAKACVSQDLPVLSAPRMAMRRTPLMPVCWASCDATRGKSAKGVFAARSRMSAVAP